MENISEYEISLNVEEELESKNNSALHQEHESNLESLFEEMYKTISNFKKVYLAFRCKLKTLKKQVKRENKQLNKKLNKLKLNKKIKKPSGFAKPVPITKELCEFLGKPEDTLVNRTEVTRFIIKYIKDNHLQSISEKKRIIPDDKLQHLLDVDSTEEITYFNIQKYMNQHFLK